ncbi:PREDICTED: uncharacterized protein LOC105563586 [Vollenhovia emeryi]|uniref:uncharacterized protein LOC105563586 n=1 Tax=Vollenhovia emeryi TaxID=411798 RepID=UPI0005F44B03|nr:PREDICTED: uncharacterized protein LOC105563586 [Vollenhovia emeryi]
MNYARTNRRARMHWVVAERGPRRRRIIFSQIPDCMGFNRFSKHNNNQKVKLFEEVDSINSTTQLTKESSNSLTPKTISTNHLETGTVELNLQDDSLNGDMEICRTPTKKIRYPGDKYELIKLIILEYLEVKLRYEGKVLSLKEHDNFVRHTCTKTVLFKGQ